MAQARAQSDQTQADQTDQALVRHFVRLFGHKPAPGELERYQRARSRVQLRQPARLRRGAAWLIVRL